MTPDDIAALTEICHPDAPWTASDVARMLAAPSTRLLSRENSACLLASLVPPDAEILLLDVHPERRRRGLARDLVRDLKEMAEVIHLEVDTGNTAARALYQALGFEVVGQRKRYYARADGAHADAVIMCWRAAGERDHVAQESVDPPSR